MNKEMAPFTFNEYYNGKTGLSVGIEEVLFSEHTPYQKVEVLKTDTWGNLMTIDDMVMLSEKDEFVYHEMLAHVPMFSHSNPKKVLIIGGGDGGTAREVLRHPSVESVELVEIDEAVVRASKQYLKEVGDWSHPNLKVFIEDGIEFIQNTKSTYDVIIIDGSDPVGPAQGLFQDSFIDACHRALNKDGMLATQTESPWIPSYHSSIQEVFRGLRKTFDHSSMYLAYIPLYPSGMWSFGLASKMPIAEKERNERIRTGLNVFEIPLKYYNKDTHIAAFALPNFVREIIG
ncbi:MAG: polyamine aminopropyltransferase [Bacteroidota bacterium]